MERAIDQCFRTEPRRGAIAVSLADLFFCFPEDARENSFAELVDAVYEFKDKWVLDNLLIYIHAHRLDEADKCLVVQNLAAMLSEDYVERRFGHALADLTQAEITVLAAEAVPPTLRRAYRDMQMLARNPLYNQGEPRYPFSMDRLVEPSMHRRMGMFRLIERSELAFGA